MSSLRIGIQRVVRSSDRVSRKDCDLVEPRTDSGVPAHQSRKINRGGGSPAKVIGVSPEQEGDHGSCGVTDSLIDAVIRANAGQRLTVIGWEPLFERPGTRLHSACRIVSE